MPHRKRGTGFPKLSDNTKKPRNMRIPRSVLLRFFLKSSFTAFPPFYLTNIVPPGMKCNTITFFWQELNIKELNIKCVFICCVLGKLIIELRG